MSVFAWAWGETSKLWVMNWDPLCILVNRFEGSWAGLGRSGKSTLGPGRGLFHQPLKCGQDLGVGGDDLMSKPTVKAGLGGFCTNTVITCPPSSDRK